MNQVNPNAYALVGDENRYQYNGKEMNGDFGLDWLDYGARFYDGALGRWLSVDPKSSSFHKESPYIFVGNNPILNFDVGGEFRIDAQLRANYPNIANFIDNNFGGYVLGSEKIKASLLKYSVGQLTEEKITEATTPNSGPNVGIFDDSEFDNRVSGGQYDFHDNTIKLDKSFMDKVEGILGSSDATDIQKSSSLMGFVATFLNEFTHYGDALDGQDAIKDKNGNIVNRQGVEGSEANIKQEFDEGNAAVGEVFFFYGNDSTTGFRNTVCKQCSRSALARARLRS